MMQRSRQLPTELYRAKTVRALDACAINDYKIPGKTLMYRAGQAAFNRILALWPDIANITIVCGVGNNAGDGFVVAKLANAMGFTVQILHLGDITNLSGDAKFHYDKLQNTSVSQRQFDHIGKTELIVDAILGTGLERPVSGEWLEAINTINSHPADCLALDIPSGLNSDSGQPLGGCVKAKATISFVGLKQGMFTGRARDFCGDIYFDNLEIPPAVYKTFIADAKTISWSKLKAKLPKIKPGTYKNQKGHVLIIGGAPGFSGATMLAAQAAMRTGVGLVSIASHFEHAALLNLNFPEAMVHAIDKPDALKTLIAKADAIILGPGLGTGSWSQSVFEYGIKADKPLLIDADGLNLLAKTNLSAKNKSWVLTPHPGEAGRLLSTNAKEIERDRFAALAGLIKKYKSTVVLKGAGALTGCKNLTPKVCIEGNPGMATAGAGDVLSGIIGALLAQGIDTQTAAKTGVCLHAKAGDKAAKRGEIGMIASDIIRELLALLNANKQKSQP